MVDRQHNIAHLRPDFVSVELILSGLVENHDFVQRPLLHSACLEIEDFLGTRGLTIGDEEPDRNQLRNMFLVVRLRRSTPEIGLPRCFELSGDHVNPIINRDPLAPTRVRFPERRVRVNHSAQDLADLHPDGEDLAGRPSQEAEGPDSCLG